MIPKVQSKRGIDAAEGCNEMIFQMLNSMFSSIESIGSSRCDLESDVVVGKKMTKKFI